VLKEVHLFGPRPLKIWNGNFSTVRLVQHILLMWNILWKLHQKILQITFKIFYFLRECYKNIADVIFDVKMQKR